MHVPATIVVEGLDPSAVPPELVGTTATVDDRMDIADVIPLPNGRRGRVTRTAEELRPGGVMLTIYVRLVEDEPAVVATR